MNKYVVHLIAQPHDFVQQAVTGKAKHGDFSVHQVFGWNPEPAEQNVCSLVCRLERKSLVICFTKFPVAV